MMLGTVFLLLFSGGVVAILNLGAVGLAPDSARRQLRLIGLAGWVAVIFVWATVILGTYWIYPWYRAKPPAGAALAAYPKYLLVSKPQTAEWHEFGMEWKEHIAWLAPFLITAAAAIVTFHGRVLVRDAKLRRAVLLLFGVAFFCAAVASAFGALINKAAPIR
jgi:phosphoglycerol transferase MdoB-like AlkP superfamily enzyme